MSRNSPSKNRQDQYTKFPTNKPEEFKRHLGLEEADYKRYQLGEHNPNYKDMDGKPLAASEFRDPENSRVSSK